MLVGRVAQKSDLLSVTATPFTEQEMNTQAKSLAQGKFAVECLRLETGRRFAAWGKISEPSNEGFHDFN